ncbi:MAG: formate dehydrogenase accessory sulfurtransferase FdhD, partial [Deltaproteobacteria bacterium]
MASQFYIRRPMKAYREGVIHDIFDPVVIETQMTIVVNDKEVAALACSPANYEELAVGYMVSEGLLSRGQSINSLKLVSENRVLIEADLSIEPSDNKVRVVNTCMGKGLTSPAFLVQESSFAPRGDCIFKARDLLSAIEELNSTSETFRLTGGVHSAGLGQGSSLLVRYED